MKFSFKTLLATIAAFVFVALAGASQYPSPKTSPTTSLSPVSSPLLPSASHSGALLRNPGFEEGKNPWFSMATWGTDLEISDSRARTGTYSALLRFDSDKPATPGASAEVHGVVQEIQPTTFPQKISGWYFVESWQTGAPHQYLQFVVIVMNAKNIPETAQFAGSHQIRFPLAGIDTPPFDIRNAKFIFVNKALPKIGQWVYFERNIAQDFIQQWGEVPEGFDKIRLFFEARYDNRTAQDKRALGTVYYDDLVVE